MKNEGNKEMFYYKNQRLTKDIRKPFFISTILLHKPVSRRCLRRFYVKSDVFLPCKKNVKATQLALNKFTLFLLHQNLIT